MGATSIRSVLSDPTSPRAQRDRVNRQAVAASTVAVLLVLAGTLSWHHDNQLRHDSRTQIIAMTLEPVAALINENQAILKELQSEPFTDKDAGILESYLAKIRLDGVVKHADMKQRLDQLAENNTAIVTLLKAYASSTASRAFTVEADKFRNYASAWRDRWNSVMELFMAGGSYPAAGVPFPSGFPDAVQAEIRAAQ